MELEYTGIRYIQIEEKGIGISKIHHYLDAKNAEDFLRGKRKEFNTKKEWIEFINTNIAIAEINILKAK